MCNHPSAPRAPLPLSSVRCTEYAQESREKNFLGSLAKLAISRKVRLSVRRENRDVAANDSAPGVGAFRPTAIARRSMGSGLTTPDKPVARRPSTVSLCKSLGWRRNERASEQTNVGPASHRSTLLRMLLFVPLASTQYSTPLHTLPLDPSLSLSVSLYPAPQLVRVPPDTREPRFEIAPLPAPSWCRKKDAPDTDARCGSQIRPRTPSLFSSAIFAKLDRSDARVMRLVAKKTSLMP